MVLDTRKYELIYGTGINCKQETWKLTKTEMKLLKLFSDGEVHSSEEIFKKCKFHNVNTTRVSIYRLKKKVKELEFTVIAKVGYRLLTYVEVV